MDIEQTEEKDNDKINLQVRKKIFELVEHLQLDNVNLIYENCAHLESTNSRNSLESICSNLYDETWINFQHLNKIYSIENEEMLWLGCCLYFSYEKIFHVIRKRFRVENKDQQYQSLHKRHFNEKQVFDSEIYSEIDHFPFFSILKLLRFLKIDLSKFLKISCSLVQILNIPVQFRNRLVKIESNFSVVSVLYKKYETIFKNIFNHSFECLIDFFSNDQHPTDQQSKIKSKDFFKFGWLLFINIKNQYPQISSDLVNSYHLLVCCVNYMYQNVENLNDQFFLRISISRKNGLKSLKFNKFVDYVCKKYDGNSVEIKTVNEYYFRPQIENLFPDKTDNIELLDIVSSKLDQKYENIIWNRNNNVMNTENSINFDIDERVFLKKLDYCEKKISIAQDDKILFSIKLPDCLEALNDYSIHESKSQKFDFQKILDLFKTLFINDAMKNFNESIFDDNLTQVKENIIYLLNEFFIIVYKFYLFSIEILITNEKKRLGSDSFLKKLHENEAFHKSVYTCCFEILLNSSFVSKSSNSISVKLSTKVKLLDLIELKCDQFRFPYSLKNIKLEPIDLLRIIELFITNTSINNQPNSICLNKPIIKNLSTIEESILELLCWSKESKLWTLIRQLKLVNSSSNSSIDITQLNYPFPLYDEVGFVNNSHFSNSGSSASILSAAVLTNSKSESSPAKPTITRVVCSTNSSSSTTTTVVNDNVILTTKTLPNNSQNKQIQVLTLTPTGSKAKYSKNTRLLNMTNFLTYFFRKFYNLANFRLRNLLDKLNINYILNEPDVNQPNSKQTITPIAATSTPVLTPVTSSHIKSIQTQNSEKHQILLKKIWNIFEYSLCFGIETNNSLIRGRHLDQILLCAVYLACKLTNLPILFTDILKAYKSLRPDSSTIYRDVLLDKGEYYADLIQFYNTIYIKSMKEFAFKLNTKFNSQNLNNSENKMVITPVNNLHLLSPVPRPTQINLNINLQFTSRKIMSQRPIFISPSRDRLISSTAQFVQPINSKYTGRNKLVYVFGELDSNKVINQINEMAKKNEVKVRTSNKRLFSDISSYTLPINTSNFKAQSASDDERDGRVKLTKISSFGSGQSRSVNSNAMISHSGATSSNFLSKIVSSKLGSTSNSNLVTMVVSSSSNQNTAANVSMSLGTNFARRIQTIQNERTNVN